MGTIVRLMFHFISFLIRFIASNFNEFLAKNGPYMSAAIAFYAFFSLFPLSLAIIASFSLFLVVPGFVVSLSEVLKIQFLVLL